VAGLPLIPLAASRYAMPSTHNRKGRTKHNGGFVQLPYFMLSSAAWGSLTPAARCVWISLCRRYKGHNNGWLALSVRDAAAENRINKGTASAAFKALEGRGFIECVVPGGFSRKTPHATEWRLTHVRCDRTGTPPEKGFMRWVPPTNGC
jgi:hypothetical protein